MIVKTLRVIIVNWNGGDHIRACIKSLAQVQGDEVTLESVVVIDNASQDGSWEGLEALVPHMPIRVLRNKTNLGFAAACNQGAAGSQADYLLFLNPDTRLMEGAFQIPACFMQEEANADVGICGIQLLEEGGGVARSCARFPTPYRLAGQILGLDRFIPSVFKPHFMTEWDHKETRSVDQVIGAFFWIRGKLFRQLGGFDEQFFVYYEEVDLSLRVRQAGYRSVYLADAQAYHEGGGTTNQVKATRLFYSLRSRILYSHKHFAHTTAVLLALMTLTIEPVTRLVLLAARRDWRSISATIEGFSKLWSLPRLIFGVPNHSTEIEH